MSSVYDVAVADVNVAILTFTSTEATAVRELLSGFGIGSTVWTPTYLAEGKEGRLSDGRTVRVQHHPLSAQGNVIAATELSRSVRENLDDYYIFYGCCGTADPNLVGKVFRVASVSYMSLGVVVDSPNGEVVKLKNKWIVRTDPDEQEPLKTIVLPAGSAGAAGSVAGLGLPDAHVLATDKVVKIAPGAPPARLRQEACCPVYSKEDWTYAQALAQYTERAMLPVLIDMETFGIASAMRALGLSDRVIVLRVVTDALSSKVGQTDQQQLDYLKAGLAGLAAAIATILGL